MSTVQRALAHLVDWLEYRCGWEDEPSRPLAHVTYYGKDPE